MRGIVTVVAGLALLGFAAPASSQCKGLKRADCVKQAACQWVKGHKRKGKAVKAHCRAKPAKKVIKKADKADKKIGSGPAADELQAKKTPKKVVKKKTAKKVVKKKVLKKKTAKKKPAKKSPDTDD